MAAKQLRRLFFIFLFLLLCMALTLQIQCAQSLEWDQAEAKVVQQLSHQIKKTLESKGWRQTKIGHDEARITLLSFYAKHNYQPIWILQLNLLPASQDLVREIALLPQHGLDPGGYHSPRLLNKNASLFPIDVLQWSSAKANQAAEVDISLTIDFLKLAEQMSFGKVASKESDVDWFVSDDPTKVPLTPEAMRLLVKSGDLKMFIAGLSPMSRQYQKLQLALEGYQQMQKNHGWPQLPEALNLKKGDSDSKMVPLLRSRLARSHDLAVETNANSSNKKFDTNLEQGVRNFQARHGLTSNGVINKETIRELNIPVERRIQQLEVNLERWRWLPRELPSRFAFVNTADFRLLVIEDERSILSMNVVVGQEFRKTPSFNSVITAVETNPKWIVPRKLAIEDLLPILQKDPSLLVGKGYRVFAIPGGKEIDPLKIDWKTVTPETYSYALKQDSGPANALGKLKFWLPNPFGIFLHDTSAKDLFERKTRMFSSGCIRLENPIRFAEYLLSQNPNWDLEKFKQEIESGVNRRLNLAVPLPIYVLYWTAWVDHQDVVHFRPDIYHRDESIRKILHAKVRSVKRLQ